MRKTASLRLFIAAVFILAALVHYPAEAFFSGKDCGEKVLESYRTQVNTVVCSNPALATQCAAEVSCFPILKQLVSQCQSTIITDLAALQQANSALGDVQGGKFDSATKSVEATKTNTQVSGATNAAPGAQGCTTPLGKGAESQIKGLKNVAAMDAANTAGQAGQTASAGGSLMGKMMPALIGAGLGGLLGYMLGSDDEESSSSAASESPPELPPPPETAESSSSTSTSSSSSVASSDGNITTPAVVEIPTIAPNERAGDGNSEIVASADDAIVDDSYNDGSSSSSSVEIVDTTTGGGTTGNGTEIVSSASSSVSTEDGAGRDVTVVDDGIVSLSGSGRALAGSRGAAGPALNFDMPSGEASSAAIGSGGSGMQVGVPTANRSRGLAGSSSSRGVSRSVPVVKASASSASNVKATSTGRALSGARSSSSSLAPRTRQQILDDLKKRGVLPASK